MGNPKPRVRTDDSGQVVRYDGWANLMSSEGTSRDPSEYARNFGSARIPQNELENIYRSDGIGKRIVDIPAQEMTREWVAVEMDEGADAVLQKLQELHAQTQFADAIRWSGLYGGSIMVMGVDDGQRLEQPINEGRVQDVEFLHVYDRWQVYWTQAQLYSNPNSPKYNRPEHYTIQPILGAPFDVHESRILIFDGEPIPERLRWQNNGWGDSRLQSVYNSVRDLNSAYSGVTNIIRDFIQPILKMSNLGELISTGREDEIKKRLEIMGISRSILNVLLIDGQDEDYEKKSSSVSGLSELVQTLMLRVTSECGIPATKLFGRSPEGENATGESDARNFYDDIKNEQETRLRPKLERLIRLIMLSRRGPTNGQEPEDWAIKFNPLWQPSAKEQADTMEVTSRALVALEDRQMLTLEESRRNLEAGGFDLDEVGQ